MALSRTYSRSADGRTHSRGYLAQPCGHFRGVRILGIVRRSCLLPLRFQLSDVGGGVTDDDRPHRAHRRGGEVHPPFHFVEVLRVMLPLRFLGDGAQLKGDISDFDVRRVLPCKPRLGSLSSTVNDKPLLPVPIRERLGPLGRFRGGHGFFLLVYISRRTLSRRKNSRSESTDTVTCANDRSLGGIGEPRTSVRISLNVTRSPPRSAGISSSRPTGSSDTPSHGGLPRPSTTARPDTSRRPPATSRRPPATSRRPPATSRRPPAASRRPPAASRRPPATSRRPPATSRRPPAASLRPPATSRRPPATSRRPPATSLRPPPASRRPPATSRRPPATSRRPPAASRRPPAASRRPPATSRRPPATSRRPPAAS